MLSYQNVEIEYRKLVVFDIQAYSPYDHGEIIHTDLCNIYLLIYKKFHTDKYISY